MLSEDWGNTGKEIKLEFTSLSCNRLIIKARESWGGGSQGSARNVSRSSKLKRGNLKQKKEKVYLQHLAPQRRARVENGCEIRIGSRGGFLCGRACEPGRRPGRRGRGAGPRSHMCFPLIAGDSPVAPSWPDKAVLKHRQSTVSKQSEKERECCSGNSSGMGRDLAAVPLLENLTGAASECRLGLLTPGGPEAAASFPASQHTPRLRAISISCLGKQTREVGDCGVLPFPHFSSLSKPAMCLHELGVSREGVCVCVCKSELHHLNIWCGLVISLSPTPFRIWLSQGRDTLKARI